MSALSSETLGVLAKLQASGSEYWTEEELVDFVGGDEPTRRVVQLAVNGWLVTPPRDCRPSLRLVSPVEREVWLMSLEMLRLMEGLRVNLIDRKYTSVPRLEELRAVLQGALEQLAI